MAYSPVLTEYTSEIAIGKEYSSRAPLSNKWSFLPKVWTITGDDCPIKGLTKPYLPLCPIYSAVAGTEGALPKDI